MNQATTKPTGYNRRKFLATTSTTMLACLSGGSAMAAPAIRTSKTEQAKQFKVTGDGEFEYRFDHSFCQLPDRYKWQTTHNVAVDSENNLYVIHQGFRKLKGHPAIFVFGPDGKFIRAFGSQFQGGGHGIEIRNENGEDFIYVAAYLGIKSFAKLTLNGDILWYKKAPMESGKYAGGEDLSTEARWDRQGFLPTNFAFLDNGGFLLADGYGSYFIHEYDQDANWVRCFGGPGEQAGQFNLSHGLWVDNRDGKQPTLYVTDRSRDQIQILNLDGTHVETLEGFGMPANFDTYENLMLVPELKGLLTILDPQNRVLARLGDGRERLGQIEKLREKSEDWVDGQFVHPHDACFDKEGNIFVAEWVQTGRVTKLSRLS